MPCHNRSKVRKLAFGVNILYSVCSPMTAINNSLTPRSAFDSGNVKTINVRDLKEVISNMLGRAFKTASHYWQLERPKSKTFV